MQLISSPANPLFKRIRKLRQRKHREVMGALFVEGIAPVWQAVDSGAEVETLVVAPGLLTSAAATRMVEERASSGTAVARVSPDAFASIAERENPSGLGAVVRIPARSLDDIPITRETLVVALWEAGNPGNLGTIVRTADAAGAAGVVVAGSSADPWSPGAVRASLGTVFATPVATTSTSTLLDWARDGGLGIVATSARGDADLWRASYPSPCLLLFGSEGTGLPPEALDAADLVIRIPQRGAATSLNLAVAAGIVIYEVARSRAATG